jgi:hypothetical protein
MVFVHRTNLHLNSNEKTNGIPNNKDLYNIMHDGLKNYGHANAAGGSAFLNSTPSITCTMTPLEGFAGYVNLISPYKENDAIVLACFPKDWINGDGDLKGNIKDTDIYNFIDDVPAVKPNHILGALLKQEDGSWKFHFRDEIINQLYEVIDNQKAI